VSRELFLSVARPKLVPFFPFLSEILECEFSSRQVQTYPFAITGGCGASRLAKKTKIQRAVNVVCAAPCFLHLKSGEKRWVRAHACAEIHIGMDRPRDRGKKPTRAAAVLPLEGLPGSHVGEFDVR